MEKVIPIYNRILIRSTQTGKTRIKVSFRFSTWNFGVKKSVQMDEMDYGKFIVFFLQIRINSLKHLWSTNHDTRVSDSSAEISRIASRYALQSISYRARSINIEIFVISQLVHRLRHLNYRKKLIGKLNRDLINEFWQNKKQSQFWDPTLGFERMWSQARKPSDFTYSV